MRAIARCSLITLVLVGCVGCDQLSKTAARQYLAGTGVHSYLGDTLRLQLAHNAGAFLNLGDSLPPSVRYEAFIVGVGALVVALLAWAALSGRLSWPQRIAVALMGAGGLGNVIDRIRFDGAVTDFLNLGVGSLRTGIFNLADATLMLGILLLLLDRGRRRA
jgi:signal peptidase II